MQIEAYETACPGCGARPLAFSPVLHHMLCAYVGPEYDFLPSGAGYACPKCRGRVVSGDTACEIIGTSARCPQCHREMVVAPPAHDRG